MPVSIIASCESLERKRNMVKFSLGFYAPTLVFCTALIHNNSILTKNPYITTAIAIPALLLYASNYS